MQYSIVSILILIFIIMPGIIGDKIYRTIIGIDWREKEIQIIIRLLCFSIFGLMLYYIFSVFFKLPPPLHILPTTYSRITFENPDFSKIFFPYSGHIIGGVIAGLLGALI